MIMTPVISSNIESIGYIAEKQELFVKFKNCKTFCYKDVSALEARELTKSASVGRHFSQYIKAVKVGSEVAAVAEPINHPMTDKEKIKLLRDALGAMDFVLSGYEKPPESVRNAISKMEAALEATKDGE